MAHVTRRPCDLVRPGHRGQAPGDGTATRAGHAAAAAAPTGGQITVGLDWPQQLKVVRRRGMGETEMALAREMGLGAAPERPWCEKRGPHVTQCGQMTCSWSADAVSHTERLAGAAIRQRSGATLTFATGHYAMALEIFPEWEQGKVSPRV